MTFAIGMAVRKDDIAMAEALERELVAQRPAIEHVLDLYSVPRLAIE